MGIFRQLLAMFRRDRDLEHAGPQFSGNKQALSNWIVSDAIEHGFRFETIDWAQKPCEVNPSDYIARLRRNPSNAIAMPQIGENLSFHEL